AVHQRWLEPAQQSPVRGPAPVLGGEDEEEQRRVDAAVVAGERYLVDPRHLARAQLVQDLARLLVAPLVALLALVRGEGEQRVARDAGVEGEQLQRGDQA